MFDWDGFHFEVVDMDGRRIDKVMVNRVAGGEAHDHAGATDLDRKPQ
jgi:CBS domain containing-hemolysin-like protein